MFFSPHIFPGIVHPMACGSLETNQAARLKQPSLEASGSNANSSALKQLSARDREPAGPLGSSDCGALAVCDSGTCVHLPIDFLAVARFQCSIELAL